MEKVFITGGSGALGKVLVKHLSKSYDVCSPSSTKCDITNYAQLEKAINDFNPDTVIHLAAFVDTFGCEQDKSKAIDVNIGGTINLTKILLQTQCRLIYISSEYVFKGDKGNYSINDKLDPINVYGKTKASAEYVISILDSFKILRVPFIKELYPSVFTDQYCSRYFLDEVAPLIEFNILNNPNNLIHISPVRKSLYQTYVDKGYNPKPIITPLKYKKLIPRDTSLINNSI